MPENFIVLAASLDTKMLVTNKHTNKQTKKDY